MLLVSSNGAKVLVMNTAAQVHARETRFLPARRIITVSLRSRLMLRHPVLKDVHLPVKVTSVSMS